MPTVLLIAALLSSGFGPTTSGLQLAVKIDSKASAAEFHVLNTSKSARTFVERYSCSGLSHFSISLGKSRAKLDTHYHWEGKVRGLTTKITTRCTVNVPVKFRTVKPGKTAVITIPFAKPGSLLSGNHRVLRADALLMLRGNISFTHLRSRFVTP